jgi:hypothetical protein
MKRFMLLGVITASIALADDPVHWTTQAPSEAADVPVYIGRTAEGIPVYADGTTDDGWYQRAAIYTHVEYSTEKLNRDRKLRYVWRGEPAGRTDGSGEFTQTSHAWEFDCARRSYSVTPQEWQQAASGTVAGVAWTYLCTGVTTDPSASAGASPNAVHVPKRMPAAPGRGFPRSDDYYPPESPYLLKSGAVTVRACVGTNGFLTAPPTVDRSSGSPRLDASALELASAGSGHYRPATLDGVPVKSCFLFKVTFR